MNRSPTRAPLRERRQRGAAGAVVPGDARKEAVRAGGLAFRFAEPKAGQPSKIPGNPCKSRNPDQGHPSTLTLHRVMIYNEIEREVQVREVGGSIPLDSDPRPEIQTPRTCSMITSRMERVSRCQTPTADRTVRQTPDTRSAPAGVPS